MNKRLGILAVVVLGTLVRTDWASAQPVGYYRQPAIHDRTVVFVAEGDLWKTSTSGGVATRLTSHAGNEGMPAISPDGKTVAFTARYEGPTEVYAMPLGGGRPIRLTFDAARSGVVGWTADGKILASTNIFSTLPSAQLTKLELKPSGDLRSRTVIPLAQAADGAYDDSGKTLFFTRLPFQGSHTKRYKGGTAQNLWRFVEGEEEATPLTADYAGTSKRPMWWNGRVYFATDRDGTMNIWSMAPNGKDRKQHTRHSGWSVKGPSLSGGRIVYQLGADLRLYDIAGDTDRAIDITLDSDLDQMRENWVEKPEDYITSAHLSHEGDRVAITARGRVFVAPHPKGRFVAVTQDEGIRNRNAVFFPDGETILSLSDESGEVELWQLPSNGVGDRTQFTTDGDVLRWDGIPSPDGKFVVHNDKNQRLFLYDIENKKNLKIAESKSADFNGMSWSPDSRWLVYVGTADNTFRQIHLYNVADATTTAVTTDRFESYSPVFSPDGDWLYLLSDRNLQTIVNSPWGNYQPEPHLAKKTKVYQIALVKGTRSPFAPDDELNKKDEKDKEEDSDEEEEKKETTDDGDAKVADAEKTDDAQDETKGGKDSDEDDKDGDESKKDKDEVKEVKIDLDGIQNRLLEVPIPAGNYGGLSVNDKVLFWTSRPVGDSKRSLSALKISNEEPEVKTVADDIRNYEVSGDGKKLLIRKDSDLHIVDAKADEAKLDKKSKVDLSGWSLSVQPRREWRQMFAEAWRLERDYFYDRNMHGVDWPAMLKKYLPLVDRVTNRAELSDLISQMVSELSALHIFVYGGDNRTGDDDVQPASLGAQLIRDQAAGGYRVGHIYQSDPDEVGRRNPLRRSGVDMNEGDVIEMINGMDTLAVADVGLLLRNQSGRQVLLRVKPADGSDARDVIIEPVSMKTFSDLRYHEWEYTRRLRVDESSDNEIGYVHLRAMGRGNFTEWAKGYFPVFNRKGLIIDVRHNRGGNIDSWILNRLIRKVWFYWSQRVGNTPMWNMQYAFRGHIVVLCNERTASDGEAFSEGIKRLEIGKVIGTRTWGGEIWLSSNNFLVDRGIATAAEYGVYGPEGDWLIEGHGVEPDIVIDNLPHATFKGKDAQLEAAVRYLQKQIEDHPIPDQVVPKHPDKSFNYPPNGR